MEQTNDHLPGSQNGYYSFTPNECYDNIHPDEVVDQTTAQPQQYSAPVECYQDLTPGQGDIQQPDTHSQFCAYQLEQFPLQAGSLPPTPPNMPQPTPQSQQHYNGMYHNDSSQQTFINYSIVQPLQKEQFALAVPQENIAPCNTDLNFAQTISEMYGIIDNIQNQVQQISDVQQGNWSKLSEHIHQIKHDLGEHISKKITEGNAEVYKQIVACNNLTDENLVNLQDSLISNINLLDRHIENFNQEVEDRKNRQVKISDQVQQLSNELDQIKRDVEKQHQQMKYYTDAQIENKISNIKEDQLGQSKAFISVLTQQIEARLKATQQREQQNIQDEINSKWKDFKQEIEIVNRKNEKTKNEIDRALNKLSQWKSNHEQETERTASKHISTLKSQFETLQEEAKCQQIKMSNKILELKDSSNERVTQVQQDLKAQFQQAISALTLKIEKNREQAQTEAEQKALMLRQESESLSNKLKQIEKEWQQAREKLSIQFQESQDNVQMQIVDFQKQIQRQKEEYTSSSSKMQHQLAEMEAKLRPLEQKLLEKIEAQSLADSKRISEMVTLLVKQSETNTQENKSKRGRGRPKGSKNKKKTSSEEKQQQQQQQPQEKSENNNLLALLVQKLKKDDNEDSEKNSSSSSEDEEDQGPQQIKEVAPDFPKPCQCCRLHFQQVYTWIQDGMKTQTEIKDLITNHTMQLQEDMKNKATSLQLADARKLLEATAQHTHTQNDEIGKLWIEFRHLNSEFKSKQDQQLSALTKERDEMIQDILRNISDSQEMQSTIPNANTVSQNTQLLNPNATQIDPQQSEKLPSHSLISLDSRIAQLESFQTINQPQLYQRLSQYEETIALVIRQLDSLKYNSIEKYSNTMLNLQKINSLLHSYANDLRDIADEQKMISARTSKLEEVLQSRSKQLDQ